ncbi:MAG: cytochrome b N-terminal domain-containing protein, partial [Pirellulales bacterium]|nr:cytochrome b N-terminal domain-containing protein [Pirellulales bacterium]
MRKLVQWVDDRTDIRHLMREALFENIPGGAKWRYVWGSTLMFAFFVQVITGVVLWMSYSPSTQTAWESVYYIQHELTLGWFLRGVHHFMAQAMVVLLAIHLMQVVLGGAYKAPREFNFWIGLLLMLVVLGLALTGYLLPWDQKGYWATKVATKIGGVTPLIGPEIQKFAQGGSEYGHFTLTRFFALHAGILPGLLIVLVVWHLALFRKHGITAESSANRDDNYFWPHQVLKDAVACLVVMAVVVFLTLFLGAPLGAPADPATEFAAARPEWYFLFLFQFLKFFHGEVGEIIGAIVVPGAVMGVLFLMPILGKWKLGHRFNVVFLFGILGGAGVLTYL